MRLANKIAIITGSGSGIGAATAKRFVEEGATVVVADKNLPAAETVAADATYQSLYSAEPPSAASNGTGNGKRGWRMRKTKRDAS